MRDRHGRVQPVARRLVSELRAHRPRFQRSQNGGRYTSAPGPSLLAITGGSQSLVDAPAKENELLRRHRHHDSRPVPALGDRRRRVRRRCSRDRRARWTRRSQAFKMHRSVGRRSGARARPRGHARARSRTRAQRPDACSCSDQGAAVRGRDQRGARHRVHGDRAAAGPPEPTGPVRRSRRRRRWPRRARPDVRRPTHVHQSRRCADRRRSVR